MLRPGESGELSVNVLLGEPGRHVVSVKIETNSVQEPDGVVYLRWDGFAPIQVEPESAIFGNVFQGTTESVILNVSRRVDDRCTCESVTVSESDRGAGLSARLVGDQIVVTVLANNDLGVHRCNLLLSLQDCWRTSVRVPVSWNVVPQVAVTPATIYVGSVSPSHTVVRGFVVEALDGQGLVEGDAKRASADASVEFRVDWDVKGATRWVGKLQCVAPSEPGLFSFELPVVLYAGGEKSAQVTLTGYVKEGTCDAPGLYDN